VCGSPLVTGDWVIVSPTGINNASLAAYDRATGKRVWRGGGLQTSYGSPALAELAGSKQVLITNFEGIEGSDLKTGKPLWNYTWTARRRSIVHNRSSSTPKRAEFYSAPVTTKEASCSMSWQPAREISASIRSG